MTRRHSKEWRFVCMEATLPEAFGHDVNTKSKLFKFQHSSPHVERARFLQTPPNGKPEQIAEAESIYLVHLNAEPEDHWVLFFLGTLWMQKQLHGVAVTALVRAIQLRAAQIDDQCDIPEFFNNLGTSLKALGRYYEAEMAFKKAYSLAPDSCDVLNNLVTVYINNGTPAEAEKWAKACLQVNPQHPQAQWNLGLAYLEQGRWEEGWEMYPSGFITSGRWNRQFNCGVWDGRPCRTLATFGEQGIGDEIMFASMIPDIIRNKLCQNLIIESHPRLAGLFARSFEELGGQYGVAVRVFPTRKQPQQPPAWLYDLEDKPDFKIAMGDLGGIFRRKDGDFPREPGRYLVAKDKLVRKISDTLATLDPGAERWIGLSWEGGTVKTNLDWRSMSLTDMYPLLSSAAPGTAFLSLQYTPDAAAVCADVKERFGFTVHHIQEWVDDYELTAACVANMDLIISVCTAVVHLAGAMGKDVWCLTPARPAWRYQLTGDWMIWYPEFVKLYRQLSREHPTWLPIMSQVGQDFVRWQQDMILKGHV